MANNKKYYIDIFCQYCGVLATRKVKNQQGVNYPRYCKECEKIPENVKRVGYFNDIINGCLLHLETQTEHPVFVDRDAKKNGYYPVYASQDAWEGGLTTLWWYRPNYQLYSFVENNQPTVSSQYRLYWEGETHKNPERDQSWVSIPSAASTQRQLPANGKKQSCLERAVAIFKLLFLD
ncbi:MAG: hypothetical protein BRC33_01005 [Cyanobacteria bacterium SW_9_44_58]|nr:MAG: hypothetical protein BRC33_01005 [Cyanobacteria bacterium SW_9_44_58]